MAQARSHGAAAKKMMSPFSMLRRLVSSAFSASVKNFTIGDFHSPFSTLMKARPFAPSDFATSSRAVISPCVMSARPLALKAFTDAVAGDRRGEHLEAGGLEQCPKVHELHREARVGLVDAVAVHGVLVGEARERRGQVVVEHVLPDLLQHALEQRVDVLAVDERHLDVDLRELHLAVGAQVLVAEAAGDLEILLHARDHEDLLELLGRLRERVELAGVDARRHEVFARAFGRALEQRRRLDLVEPWESK
jgi:hypothetical protein